jgi:hypothetical protein
MFLSHLPQKRKKTLDISLGFILGFLKGRLFQQGRRVEKRNLSKKRK